MGVINLGAIVEKLKAKLSGDFVTKTDYATASTGGVVKVGTTGGLQVSSGTLKGKTLADATAYAAAGNDVVMTKGDMAFVGGGGSTLETVIEGDYTEAAQYGNSYLRTSTGKDLTQYKLLFVNMGGSSNGSTSCVVWAVSSMKDGMGYYLNENGGTSQIQYTLAKSSGSEIYDSIYVSHGSNLGKWGPVYGIK